MQPKNDQIPINQALNETAKSQQPKKTWQDPAMTILDINSGKYFKPYEISDEAGPNYSQLG